MVTRKGLRNKRNFKNKSRTIRRRKGGAPVPEPAPAPAPAPGRLAEVKLAAQELNNMLVNPAYRTIVKRRLEILYGTSETWKKLRNGVNAAGFSNAAQYNGLPDDIKIAFTNLCDKIRQVFAQPYSVSEYTGIIMVLLNNNLYKKTHEQFFNNNDNNDNMSNSWSNAGNNHSIHNNMSVNSASGNEEDPQ